MKVGNSKQNPLAIDSMYLVDSLRESVENAKYHSVYIGANVRFAINISIDEIRGKNTKS